MRTIRRQARLGEYRLAQRQLGWATGMRQAPPAFDAAQALGQRKA